MIDTKALRSRVLDLAIWGKLTEQLPSDGTAEELYQQIQAEKQALIKEGKIKKEKPLPEISADEVPFDIPNNWKWTYMGDIFQHNTGKALNSANTDGQLLEYITTSNVYWDRFELKELKQMYFSDTEIEKCTIKKGDLLICEGGDIGRSAIWNNDFEMRIQNHLHRLRGFFSGLNVKYYYFLMMLYKEKGMIDGRGIGLQGFSSKRVHNLIVPLPPLAEQKRIVERVEEIFRLLDTIDKAQEKYSADSQILKAKLITAGIQGKLTKQLPSDGTAEELYQQIQAEKQKLIKEGKLKKEKSLPPVSPEEVPFEIPENWMWCHLGECITLQSGQDFKPSDYNADNIGTPYLTGASNIAENGDLIINRWTEKPTCIANTDDVLIVCKGSGYGKITICTIDYAHIARQFMAVKKSEFIDTKFMKLFLVSKLSVIKNNGQGLIPGIDRPSVLNLPFPLPPLAEQKRIADVLERALE